jgi:hypothetical protein
MKKDIPMIYKKYKIRFTAAPEHPLDIRITKRV